MPELPEVEIHARKAREWLTGKRIERCRVTDPLLTADGDAWDTALRGRRVAGVGRAAKYLLIELEGGLTLVVHLRMTGKLLLDGYLAGEPGPHTRLVLLLESGERLRFEDTRRFGRAWLVERLSDVPELSGLGPDALQEPTSAARLAELARGSRRSIKSLLMDQRRIGGLGNICACEVLYRAGVAPDAAAGSLGEEEVGRIAATISPYLEWAIAAQERRDLIYLGEPGAVNPFSVYARAGEPCVRCGAAIVRTVLAGRGTYSCPGCQPAGSSLATRGGRRSDTYCS